MIPSIAAEKAALRAVIKQRLAGLSAAAIMSSSNAVLQQLNSCKPFQTARSVSVYLSMAKEVQTRPILSALFARQCRVYIPKVVTTVRSGTL
jgi:5-formyltetrahydrofolate cyclo-ligase